MLPELYCHICDEFRNDYKILGCESKGLLHEFDIAFCIHCKEEIKFHKHLSLQDMKNRGIILKENEEE